MPTHIITYFLDLTIPFSKINYLFFISLKTLENSNKWVIIQVKHTGKYYFNHCLKGELK